MGKRELIALLNRAAAAIETPRDLTLRERFEVAEDCVIAAKELERELEHAEI